MKNLPMTFFLVMENFWDDFFFDNTNFDEKKCNKTNFFEKIKK